MCNNYFETPDTKRGIEKKTCNINCANKLGQLNSMVKMSCTLCGNEALITKAHSNDLKVYCINCKSDKNRYFKNCEICGLEFRTAHNDTKTCSATCTTKMLNKKIVEVECIECNESIVRPTRDVYSGKNIFCSDRCSNRYHGRIRPKKYGRSWSRWIREIRKRDNYTCQRCHKSQYNCPNLKLEIHHKIPLISFDNPEDAHYDENLITYCHNCHMDIERLVRKNKQKVS